MNATAFDPNALLQRLVELEVRFVVVGGYAAQLLGSSLMTRDLDICYARDDANLERLTGLLAEIHVTLRGAPAELPFRIDAKTLRNGDDFTFDSDLGPFDILGTADAIGGRIGYAELEPNAVALEIAGRVILVAGIDDLISMKQAAGRPKDLIGVEILGALRAELDRSS